MSNDKLATRPSTMYVDVMPNGLVVFSNIAADDSMDSCVIEMTPSTAARLGEILIDVASSVEPQ